MEYANKNRLRQLILDATQFSDLAATRLLAVHLAPTVAELRRKHEYWASDKCYSEIGQGAEAAVRHAAKVDELRHELEDLVLVLPEHIARILASTKPANAALESADKEKGVEK